VRVALASLLVLGAIGLPVCDEAENGSDGLFAREEFPFTFEYPDGFEEDEDVSIDAELGAEPEATAAVASGENNAILVQRFTLNFPIGESNLQLAEREFNRLLAYIDPEATFSRTRIAGLPALQTAVLDVPSIAGAESRLTVLFDGDREYFINCQWTGDGRAEVEQACEMALETFSLD
jgi:hypothetical protein